MVLLDADILWRHLCSPGAEGTKPVPGWHGLLFSFSYILFFKINVYLFWERERAHVCMPVHASGGGTEREGERIPSRLLAVRAKPNVPSLYPTIVRSWPEWKSRVRCLTNWATQAPLLLLHTNEKSGKKVSWRIVVLLLDVHGVCSGLQILGKNKRKIKPWQKIIEPQWPDWGEGSLGW